MSEDWRRGARAPLPPFTPELEDFRAVCRRFVETELRPHAAAWEDAKDFPDSVFTLLAEHGFLGLKYEERWGGQGDGYLADAVWTEELARCGSGGLAAGIGAHTGIATPPIWKFGTDDQKRRYLVPAIRGELICALAITEPGAGSDVAGVRTRATRVDGGWMVNGAKTYITNGVRAGLYVTAVKTSAEGGHHGMSFLLVERQDGVHASKLDKLGWDASDTGELAFDDVWVPEENLLGPLHEGFKLVMANFQWERLLMALGALGAMDAELEATRAFADARVAFGRPVSSFQVSRHAFAEMHMRLESARALTYHALRLFVEGHDAVREVTEAKLATQRLAFEVADRCLQLHGGAGYMREYGIERAARDTRLGPIGGGTDEIMKEILGRTLGL